MVFYLVNHRDITFNFTEYVMHIVTYAYLHVKFGHEITLCVRLCAYIHYTYIHTCMHTYINTYIHTYIRKYIHTQTHAYTNA